MYLMQVLIKWWLLISLVYHGLFTIRFLVIIEITKIKYKLTKKIILVKLKLLNKKFQLLNRNGNKKEYKIILFVENIEIRKKYRFLVI